MLKGIHPLLTADLLRALAAMGHGDEIVIVDANFPARALGPAVIEVAGASAPETLAAVLTLFPLDVDTVPAAMTMQVIGDPEAVPETVADFAAVFTDCGLADCEIGNLERLAFYERARRRRDRPHRRAAALRQHPARQRGGEPLRLARGLDDVTPITRCGGAGAPLRTGTRRRPPRR